MNIWASTDGNCTGKKSGTLQAVLTHELAHVLGWNSGHGGLPGSRTSLTANCTTFIPGTSSSDPISDNVCLHDVEALFRAKASGSGWTHDADYFSEPILWTTNAPEHDSIPVSTTDTIPMSQWLPLPGTPVNRTHAHLSWSSPSGLFASIGSSTGQVTTGGSTGTGKVYLKASASPPSGYLVWTPFKERGDSVTVAVIPAGPFLITSVTASGLSDTIPYLTGGARIFTASIQNAPAGTLWTEGRFIVPGIGADTVTALGDEHQWLIPGGEYGLEVQVRAYVGTTWSGSGFTTVYFPVCMVDSFAECPSQ